MNGPLKVYYVYCEVCEYVGTQPSYKGPESFVVHADDADDAEGLVRRWLKRHKLWVPEDGNFEINAVARRRGVQNI